jgi:hypothetical protein
MKPFRKVPQAFGIVTSSEPTPTLSLLAGVVGIPFGIVKVSSRRAALQAFFMPALTGWMTGATVGGLLLMTF